MDNRKTQINKEVDMTLEEKKIFLKAEIFDILVNEQNLAQVKQNKLKVLQDLINSSPVQNNPQ